MKGGNRGQNPSVNLVRRVAGVPRAVGGVMSNKRRVFWGTRISKRVKDRYMGLCKAHGIDPMRRLESMMHRSRYLFASRARAT